MAPNTQWVRCWSHSNKGTGRASRRRALTIIGDRLNNLSRRSENGILAPSARPIQILLADSGVVDYGWNSDIFIGALAGLIVGAEAPAVSFASVGDGEGVIGPRSDESAVVDAWDLGGTKQDASGSLGVSDHVVFRDGGSIDAGLAAVEATPDETLPVSSGGQRVVGAAGDMGYSVVGKFEIFDHGRSDDYGVVFASALVDASTAEGVGAPGPDLLFAVNGEGMVGTTSNVSDVLATEAEKARVERVVALALHHAEAKLVLLARAPGVDDAFVVDSKSVVRARGDIFDLLETWEKGWRLLNESVLVEARMPSLF